MAGQQPQNHSPMGRRVFLKQGLTALAAPSLLTYLPEITTRPKERLYVVTTDQPHPRIIPGTEDAYAANHLAEALTRLTGRQPEIGEKTAEPPKSGVIIPVGSAGSNQRISELLAHEPLRGKLRPEGFLLKTIPGSLPVLLLAGADRTATIYAVNELINFYLESDGTSAWVPPLSVVENPALRYRMFWTWDHSTNWELGIPGLHEYGFQNPYEKRAEDFLKDYKRVVDYMGAHKLNGLIIWGFLRDSHGGVATAKELVQYARERGVRILPGIGTSFYGGFYYEGNHPFNVDTWLSRNPTSLRFQDSKGKLLPNAICPSKLANQEWLRNGAEWLFKTFPNLGGANLENGDFFACQTEDCRRARERIENDPNFYWDMMMTQVPIIEVGSKVNQEAWFTYATYTGFTKAQIWQNTPREQIRTGVPRYVKQYPEFAVCQWTLSFMVSEPGRKEVNTSLWPKGIKPPTRHSIGLLHQGSQWWKGSHWWSTTAWGNDVGARYEEMLETIRYTAQRAFDEGLEGLEILAEVSPTSPQNELNYLALEEFCWHPNRTMEEFITKRLSRIYGGSEHAWRYLERVLSDEKNPKELANRYSQALELAGDRSLTPEQRGRWRNLANELARRMAIVAVI